MRSRSSQNTGFTLVELVVSMSILTILIGGMSSAVLISSHALPDENDLSERRAAAVEAVEQIASDLALATSVLVADPDLVRITVPDRGHGAAGPETMNFEWSGTPGDPLTHSYNASPARELCQNVHDFSVEYIRVAKPLTHAPRVLLLVENDVTPDAQDQARRTQIESWGFQVDLIDPNAGDAAFTTAMANADVMYMSEQNTTSPPVWVVDEPIGIVCEKQDEFSRVGISSNANWQWYSVLQIVDNTHEITRVFPLGPLQIFSADDYGVVSTNTIAPDGKILGSNSGYDIMVAVDVGGALIDGKMAQARRISMPWGDRTFDFNNVTDDGLTIMRRAIVWAAAPVGVSAIKITLQVGPDASGRVETQVQLLNLPEAP